MKKTILLMIAVVALATSFGPMSIVTAQTPSCPPFCPGAHPIPPVPPQPAPPKK
jgi:hypothetical protein